MKIKEGKTVMTYIPKEKLNLLNAIAARNDKNSLTNDCPILSEWLNVPVLFSISSIDSTDWVRCMIPSGLDDTARVFLDIRQDDFESLPTVGVKEKLKREKKGK